MQPHAFALCFALLLSPLRLAAQEASSLALVRGTQLRVNNPIANEHYGADVAVHGTTAAVLSQLEHRVAIFYEGEGDWQRIAQRPLPPTLDGVALALEGDVLAVSGLDSLGQSGGVTIFERNAGGNDAWGVVDTLSAPLPPFPWPFGRNFGFSLAMEGDFLFVGDAMTNFPPEPSGPGAVFAFRREPRGSTWEHVATLHVLSSASFGWKVTADGDLVAVRDGLSMVWIFERTPGENDWQPVQVLSGGARFGEAIALRDDQLLVGQPTNSNSRAQLFERHLGGTNAWGLVTTLVPGSGPPYPFGRAVAFGDDVLYVGAPSFIEEDPSFVYSFVRDASVAGGWRAGVAFREPAAAPSERFGLSLAARGNLLVAGSPDGAGRAYALQVLQPSQSQAPARSATGR